MEEKAYQDFSAFLQSELNFNLQHYHTKSAQRRLKRMMVNLMVEDLPALEELLRNKPKARELFIDHFVVRVTEMFREPAANRKMLRELFPYWAKKKSLDLWLCGCSTGAEVLSLCILLKEHNLLGKARILATDIDPKSLMMARQGRIPAEQIEAAKTGYNRSGGQVFLEEYYTQVGPECFFHEDLLQNVRFESLDLCEERPVERYDLVWCKNLLIYFQRDCQARAQNFLVSALKPDGYLMLGEKESISSASERRRLQTVSAEQRIYQMTSPALSPH